MLRCLIVGGLGLCLVASAGADVVVLKDGRKYSGEVTKTGDGYSVKTKLGTIQVSESDFAELILETAPAQVKPAPVAPVAPTPPVSPPVRPTSPGGAASSTVAKGSGKSLQPLIDQGKAALAAGDYKAARDAFSDATFIDPKNTPALHGLAAAYMYLNDFRRASAPMEKAFTSAPPDRAVVLNMAVLQIGLSNPMRATKLIREYLTAHAKDLDEPMLNAMGTAMMLASDTAKKQTLFQDAVKFYLAYNGRLEAARPGYKRWGVEWLPAKEVERREAANDAAQKKVHTLGVECDDLEAKVVRDEDDLVKKRDLNKRGFVYDYELQMAESNQAQQKERFAKKVVEYEEAVAAVKRPAFPLTMSLVALDDLTPPPPGGYAAVAMETSVEPPVVKPPTSTRKPRITSISSSKPRTSSPSGDGVGPGTPAADPPAPPVIQVVRTAVERKPVRLTTYAAAFPVSSDLVVTSAAVVKDAREIDLQTVDGDAVKAVLVRSDDATGLALLRVTNKRLYPLPLAASFAGGGVICAGFPTVNLFNPAAETISGSAKPPGADWKVNLSKHPRLPGAPLLAGNKVVGVTLITRDLEAAQAPAVTLEELRKFLGADVPQGGAGGPDPASVMLQVMATRESAG